MTTEADRKKALAERIDKGRGRWTGDEWGSLECQQYVPNLTDADRDLIIAALTGGEEGTAA